ncbi:MAG: hypothetical protein AB8B61_10530 [Cyclobacteriaceae bacterium]
MFGKLKNSSITEEALDEILNEKKSDRFIINHGLLFTNKLIVVFGYFLILLGFFYLVQIPLLGLIFLGLGGLFSFSKCGIILDRNNGTFMEYTSYFFIKKGKWYSLSTYPDAAILNLRYSQKANLGYFHSTNVKQETQQELVLLTHDHRRRILVKTFKKGENAQQFSKKLCESFKLNLTSYAPKISAKTAARRKR